MEYDFIYHLFLPQVLTPALSGLIFIFAGSILLKFPPKNINGWYGYRTAQSMLRQSNWDFAQKYSAKLMIKLGFIFLTLGFLASFIPLSESTGLILGMGALIVAAVLIIWKTELALSRFKSNKD